LIVQDATRIGATNMDSNQILTLVTSLIALASVISAFWIGNKQIGAAGNQATKQIEAATAETARRLKAEFLIKEKQIWIREFRESVNKVLYISDPDLDGDQTVKNRLSEFTRLAHAVELMLPNGTVQERISNCLVALSIALKERLNENTERERLQQQSKLTEAVRELIQNELKAIESAI
jgi:hypothetical protein